MSDITKTPRLYVDHAMSEGLPLSVEGGPHHYLRNVMRAAEGQAIRVFNGRDGEFVGRIERIDKRRVEITVENRIREQAVPYRRIHLLAPPIRKERFGWLIEKSVELGVTDFHPVLTRNTDIRKINEERVMAQMVEASEQCERLDLPALHPTGDLFDILRNWDAAIPVYAAIERMGIEPLPRGGERSCALLVGPAGGFTSAEKRDLCGLEIVRPVSLGHNILRTETAACAALSLLTL